MSDETVPVNTKIWKAMFEVQKELKGIVKDTDNSFFKSKYVDRTAILEVLKPLYEKHGLLLIQTPVIPPSPEGNLQPQHAMLAFTTTIVHVESGEAYQSTALVPLPKADPQGFGSAVTYTSRYMLTMIHGLPLLDDDGNAGSGNQSAVKKEQVKPKPFPKQQAGGTSSLPTNPQQNEPSPASEKPSKGTEQSSGQTSPPSSSPPKTGSGPSQILTKRKLWGTPEKK